MSTQLRLVEPPAPRRSSVPRTRSASRSRTTGAPRRAAHWGDWHLDARTRRVGRAGVAAARRALESARAAEPLSRAS